MKNKFTTEDIRRFVLGKLSDQDSEKLREELQWDPLLQDMYEHMKARKEELQEYDAFEFTEEDDDASLERLLGNKTAQKTGREIKPAQIWATEEIDEFLLVISETNTFNDVQIVRVVPISTKVFFKTENDVIFSEKSISFRTLIAHNNLHAIIKTSKLTHYLGAVPSEALRKITDAIDLLLIDYSIISEAPNLIEKELEKDFLLWFDGMKHITAQWKDDIFEENADSLDRPRIIYLSLDDDHDTVSEINEKTYDYKASAFGQEQAPLNDETYNEYKKIPMVDSKYYTITALIKNKRILFRLKVKNILCDSLRFAVYFKEELIWQHQCEFTESSIYTLEPPENYNSPENYKRVFTIAILCNKEEHYHSFCIL